MMMIWIPRVTTLVMVLFYLPFVYYEYWDVVVDDDGYADRHDYGNGGAYVANAGGDGVGNGNSYA